LADAFLDAGRDEPERPLDEDDRDDEDFLEVVR
jgi:hypothetical protein